MSGRTRIKFFGVKTAPYPGAARPGCKPEDPEAVGWHITVGGAQCSIDSIADFAKHIEHMLRLAYAAGVHDAKQELRDKLGLGAP